MHRSLKMEKKNDSLMLNQIKPQNGYKLRHLYTIRKLYYSLLEKYLVDANKHTVGFFVPSKNSLYSLK